MHQSLEWADVIRINYLVGNRESFEVVFSKGKIVLEKAKGNINMDEFLKCVAELSSDIVIERKEDYSNFRERMII